MKMKKLIFVLLVGIILLGGSFILLRPKTTEVPQIPQETDITTTCVTHTSLGMHIHPYLTIKILGQQQEIPANLGIVSESCMRPVHTHDNTGKVHLEYPKQIDIKLGEFFKVWGKPFSKEQLLDKNVDEKHEIKVTVNDQPNYDFENLIMKDLDKIVIEYIEK